MEAAILGIVGLAVGFYLFYRVLKAGDAQAVEDAKAERDETGKKIEEENYPVFM